MVAIFPKFSRPAVWVPVGALEVRAAEAGVPLLLVVLLLVGAFAIVRRSFGLGPPACGAAVLLSLRTFLSQTLQAAVAQAAVGSDRCSVFGRFSEPIGAVKACSVFFRYSCRAGPSQPRTGLATGEQ
jgi:hypothetical protein